MVKRALLKMALGFAFILVDVRVGKINFDLVPDIIGYILFALAIRDLERRSECFAKARLFNLALIVVSIFTIARVGNTPSFIGPIGYLIGLAGLILKLLVVYYLLMGTKEMLVMAGNRVLAAETDRLWLYFLILSAAGILTIFIATVPVLSVLYNLALLILSIVLLIMITRFNMAAGDSI